jgi:hypothetical protein
MAENQCPNCGGKFGMTRQYRGRMGFCCKNCKYEYALGHKKPPDQMELPLDKPPDDDVDELVRLLQYPPDKSYDVIS